MAVIPSRFLFRVAYPCQHVAAMPDDEGDRLLDLPESCRIDNFAGMDGLTNFADVRLAWNERGIGVVVEVRGKEQPVQGDAARPRASDGLSLWIDTRDARTAHRASRYCHMFHLLAAGGGDDRDEPVFGQSKINRALEDAPLADLADVPFRGSTLKGGYRLEAFLPAAILNGFDPEQSRRLGVFYACRDAEKGEQVLSVASEFPYWEDPSLWSVLELVH